MEEDMLLNKSVKDFMKEREEYLKIPSTITISGDWDPRSFYTEGRIELIHIYDTGQYLFKDENDNEYRTPTNMSDDILKVWDVIKTLVSKKKIHANVRDIIRAKKKERHQREVKRENISKHVTPYFMEDNCSLCDKGPIELILSEFIDYWYRWEGWRGVIRPEKVKLYINSFIARKRKSENSLKDLLEIFEKSIRKKGGVQNIV